MFQTPEFGVSYFHAQVSSSTVELERKPQIEKRRLLLSIFNTCFKRPKFGFTNKGFDFMHSFTVLYPMFLRHSILYHQA